MVLRGNFFRRTALSVAAIMFVGSGLGYATYREGYIGKASASTLSQGHDRAFNAASTNACNSGLRANNLKISRDVLFAGHDTFTFPASESVVDVAQVQRLLATLCDLPNAPHARILNCPLDLGIQYRLIFFENKRTILYVMLDASGCRLVTDIGPPRSSTTNLWAVLAKTMNLPRPVEYCDPFLGNYNGQVMPSCNTAKAN